MACARRMACVDRWFPARLGVQRRTVNIFDAELADTLEHARLRHGQPAKRQAPAAALARDLVGDPKPAPLGTCCFCGTPAPGRSVCEAHTDLEELDDTTTTVVTTATSNGSGHAHSESAREAGARR